MKFASRFASAVCAVALSAAVAVPSVRAATYVFSLTGSSSTNGTHANSRTFSATSGGTTLNMRVTGWSLTSPTSLGLVQDSFLGIYGAGLGVTSGDENGSGNTHTADNQNRYDFFVLQFDQAVSLVSGTFTPYSLGGYLDTDATVGFGTTNTAWNSQPALNNKSYATLSGVFNGGFSTLTGNGTTNTRLLNPAANLGNIWLVGAAFNNADRRVDSFKFSNLTVSGSSAVPEPATWAMMIFGFGMVGSAMRRRKVQTNVSFA
ncbi:MAG: PEPxxWA-CTERM sorting domain-containing protein [Burkholderiales bacterium]